jgi:hypothetical protein
MEGPVQNSKHSPVRALGAPVDKAETGRSRLSLGSDLLFQTFRSASTAASSSTVKHHEVQLSARFCSSRVRTRPTGQGSGRSLQFG